MPGQAGTSIPDEAVAENVFGVISERMGYQLHWTDVQAMNLIRDMLADIGLNASRATALAYIATNPDCRQADLARALGINRASALEVVNALTSLGAIAPRQEGLARRGGLTLTDCGENLHRDFLAISARAEEISFGHLTSEERAVLRNLFTTVRNRIADHLNTTPHQRERA